MTLKFHKNHSIWIHALKVVEKLNKVRTEGWFCYLCNQSLKRLTIVQLNFVQKLEHGSASSQARTNEGVKFYEVHFANKPGLSS